MDNEFSKTQIDKLGERLKLGQLSEEDLWLLDDWRRTFRKSYEHVVGVIGEQLGYQYAGRPAKSTTSICDKLLRETIRLSQMQDIAGCRIVVTNFADQDQAVARIMLAFPDVVMVNRRMKPSHGYRAVHLIVQYADRQVEVQCRSELQHLWSQLSESLADVYGPALKYGSGPKKWRSFLDSASDLVANIERSESGVATFGYWAAKDNLRQELTGLLRETIHWVSNLRDE